MSGLAISDSTKAQLNNPPLPALIIGSVLGTGIGMAAHYVKTSAIYYPVEKFGWCTAEQRNNWSVHAALSVPIRPITSYCFTKLFGCNKDTKWRNIAEYVATTLTTSVIAGIICNNSGFDVQTAGILFSHQQAFALEMATTGFKKCVEFIDEKIEGMKKKIPIDDSIKNAIDPDRVKPLQISPKIAQSSQLVFDEMEVQSGLIP